MSELEGLLGELSSEGTHHSEGRFTLDMDKAEQKLDQYRLPSPYHYVVALVASATAAGAETIRVNREISECLITFDGKAYGFEETASLFRSIQLGVTSSDRRLKSLATAVHAARTMPLVSLSLESWSGSDGVRLYLHGNEMTVQRLEESPWAYDPNRNGTNWHICESSSLTRQISCLLIGVEVGKGEFTLLRRHARYAAPTIVANGKNLNTNRLAPWPLAAKVGLDYPGVRPLRSSSERCPEFSGDGNWGGYIGFGEGVGAWLVIVDGITFQVAADESNYPTSRVVAYANDLSKDLSNTGLVQNARYEEVMASIRDALGRLVTEVSSQPLTPTLRKILEPLKAAR